MPIVAVLAVAVEPGLRFAVRVMVRQGIGMAPQAPALDWADRITALTREAPDQLLAHPLNPKHHPAAQRTALRAAMDSLGIIAPCTVNDRTGYLIDGHARVEEALSRGQATLPVLHVDLSPEEEALALLTLDPIGSMFESLRENTATLLEQVKVDSDELVAFLAHQSQALGLGDGGPTPKPDPGADFDRADELQEKWRVQPGQRWTAGRHVLLCGDATDPACVARLMGTRAAATLVTSPPYWRGQTYDSSPGEAGAQAFVTAVAQAWAPHVTRRIQVQTGHTIASMLGDPGPYRRVPLEPLWITAWAAAGWILRYQRIWAKGGAISHAGPLSDLIDGGWESILVFYRAGHNEAGQERVSAPWAQQGCWTDIPGEHAESPHPCPYPVELAERMIYLYSVPGDVVAEPFAGSGTTIVAAEGLGRACYAMELHPPYCAVALERLEGLGLEPSRDAEQ